MDYNKLIADAATKLNSLVNEIIDTFDKAGTPVNPMRIISDITAKAFPEKDGVIQSSPEQIQDLEKELGTEGSNVNEPDIKDTGMSEQERELRNAILGGMKEGPDERW